MMKSENRIRMLDFLRGFAVILMIVYHGFFTFGTILRFPFFIRGYFAMDTIAPPIISVLFIFTCAYSCRLSRNNFKRGAVIFAVALGLSFVTIVLFPLFGMENEGIRFGILHFLGIAVMLSPLLYRIVRKIPWYFGVPVCVVLAVGTRRLAANGFFGLPVTDPIQSVNVLFPFGLYHGDFFSADYYPLFPWIFVFLIGCYFAYLLPKEKLPAWCYKKICPPVEFLGRHALVVYVIHQPIIYAIGEMIALFRS